MIRILWVDDEKDFLEMMDTLLDSSGYKIQTCESGFDALEILAKSTFDIVVTDYAMPDLNGLELIRKLRNIDRNLPIILATGKPVSASKLDEFNPRITGLIFKPFNTNQIVTLITNILDEKVTGGETSVEPGG